jgi:hypothetical protein
VKAGRITAALALLLVVVVSVVVSPRRKDGQPRRRAIQTLGGLDTALRTGNAADLLKTICIPAAIQGRTATEQAQFLTKALADEISPEGLAVLQKDGAFGSLTNIFPAEAARWSAQAGAKPEDCVAFRMERAGIRAEVVLQRAGQTFRIVRCNNVSQMAVNSNHE